MALWYEVIHHTSLFGDVPPGFPPRHGRPGSSSPRAGGPSIGGYGGSSGQDPPVRTLHGRLAAGAGGSSRVEDGIRIRRGGVTGQRDAWVTKCRWLTKCMMQGSRSSIAQERDSNGAVQDSGRRSAHRGGRVLSLSLFCPLKRVRCCASNQAHNGAPVGPLTGTEDPPTWPHVSATQTRGSAAVSPNWARP